MNRRIKKKKQKQKILQHQDNIITAFNLIWQEIGQMIKAMNQAILKIKTMPDEEFEELITKLDEPAKETAYKIRNKTE